MFCLIRSANTRTVLEIEQAPNDPPALLYGLPGTGPPKRLTIGVDLTFEDVSARSFKRGNAEVLHLQTAEWVVAGSLRAAKMKD